MHDEDNSPRDQSPTGANAMAGERGKGQGHDAAPTSGARCSLGSQRAEWVLKLKRRLEATTYDFTRDYRIWRWN